MTNIDEFNIDVVSVYDKYKLGIERELKKYTYSLKSLNDLLIERFENSLTFKKWYENILDENQELYIYFDRNVNCFSATVKIFDVITEKDIESLLNINFNIVLNPNKKGANELIDYLNYN